MRAIPQTAACWSALPSQATALQSVVAPKRRRGAPAGNRNALRHGRYSAAAREARAAHRSAILCDLAVGQKIFAADKRNNSVAQQTKVQTGRKRGAPKGNGNALKHGGRSAEMQAFRAELRQFLRKARADLSW